MSLFLTVRFLQVTPLLAIRMEYMNEQVFLIWDAPLIGWLQWECAIFYTVKKKNNDNNRLFSVFLVFAILMHYIFTHDWLGFT